jgi:hypothetical protein
VDEASFFMKRLWEGAWGSSFIGDPGRCVGKVSGYGDLFSVEGNPVCEGARIRGTLLDGWRRALVVGHLPMRDSMKGTLGGRFPYQ